MKKKLTWCVVLYLISYVLISFGAVRVHDKKEFALFKSIIKVFPTISMIEGEKVEGGGSQNDVFYFLNSAMYYVYYPLIKIECSITGYKYNRHLMYVKKIDKVKVN